MQPAITSDKTHFAMRLASLCVLVTQAAALSAPRPRVAVVGPAGDTVADAVAVRSNDADVTRCIDGQAGYVDAAVVCADGGEEKLSTLAERCAGARSIVLVAPAGAADEDDGFSLPNPLKLLDGAAETNDVDEVAERCRNAGSRVAVVRHGPLFGAGARDAAARHPPPPSRLAKLGHRRRGQRRAARAQHAR